MTLAVQERRRRYGSEAISVERLLLGTLLLLVLYGLVIRFGSPTLLFVLACVGVALVVVSSARDATITTGFLAVGAAFVVHIVATWVGARVWSEGPMGFRGHDFVAVVLPDFVGASLFAFFLFGLLFRTVDWLMPPVVGALTAPAAIIAATFSRLLNFALEFELLHTVIWLVLFAPAFAVACKLRGRTVGSGA